MIEALCWCSSHQNHRLDSPDLVWNPRFHKLELTEKLKCIFSWVFVSFWAYTAAQLLQKAEGFNWWDKLQKDVLLCMWGVASKLCLHLIATSEIITWHPLIMIKCLSRSERQIKRKYIFLNSSWEDFWLVFFGGFLGYFGFVCLCVCVEGFCCSYCCLFLNKKANCSAHIVNGCWSRNTTTVDNHP